MEEQNKKKYLSEMEQLQIAEQYRDGYEAVDIARWHKISAVTVFNVLRQYGVPTHTKKGGRRPETETYAVPKMNAEYTLRYDGTEEDLYRKLLKVASSMYNRSKIRQREDAGRARIG